MIEYKMVTCKIKLITNSKSNKYFNYTYICSKGHYKLVFMTNMRQSLKNEFQPFLSMKSSIWSFPIKDLGAAKVTNLMSARFKL